MWLSQLGVVPQATGRWFNSQSRHLCLGCGLRVAGLVPVRALMRNTYKRQLIDVSHISVSLSPSLPLSLKINNKFKKLKMRESMYEC